MKNKGFTMVEILAVFTITGIILLIAVPLVINALKTSSDQARNRFKDEILLATESYIQVENIYDAPPFVITVGQLLNTGYIKSTLVNPENKKKITDDTNRKIEIEISVNEDGIYEYRILE